MHHKSIQYADVCFLDHQHWLGLDLSWKAIRREVLGNGHSQEEDDKEEPP
jgi:hypothetical protein